MRLVIAIGRPIVTGDPCFLDCARGRGRAAKRTARLRAEKSKQCTVQDRTGGGYANKQGE